MFYCFSNLEKVIMKTIHYFSNCLFIALLTLAIQGRAQDIDLYSSAALVTGTDLPNVLFVLDNAANFDAASTLTCKYADGITSPSLGNTAGGIEQCALVAAIDALPYKPDGTPVVNVGIMVYNISGTFGGYTCNGAKGGCLIYPFTAMSSTNKTILIASIKAWTTTGASSMKTSNEATAAAMQEAWAYFAGKEGISDRIYTSTALTGCQKNYVIFIGNAAVASGNPGDHDSPAAALATTIGGNTALTATQKTTLGKTITIPTGAYGTSTFSCGTYTMPDHSLSSSESKGLYADEWARYMKSTDLVSGIMPGAKNITTYTIGVLTSSCKPDYPALLTSMAANGGGKYFSTSSAADIQQAIVRILNEVQAVNSVFSSSSLPVSVNAQGTYLNQIFMGMFRPDEGGQPKWFGNLKQYQFIYDPTTKTLQLADATGTPAISGAGTGFMSPNAASFWDCTSAGNTQFYNVSPYNVLPGCNPAEPTYGFWANRINGVAGAYDLPDGEMVEKGGAAMVMRLANLTDNYNATPGSTNNPRNLYTYCPSGSTCGGTGTLLSAAPFDTSTTAITDAMLGTGSRTVTAISDVTTAVAASNTSAVTSSGGATISITALAKAGSTVTATISTTDMAKIAVGNLLKISTGATKYDCNPCTVSAITSTTTFTYTNSGGGGTATLTACPTASPSGCATILSNLVQVTPAVAPIPFPAVNQLVTFSSCTVLTGLNGTVGTITSATSTTFTVATTATVGGTDTACKYTPNTATVTSAAHGFPNGASITIAGATPAGYNGTWAITVVDANTFTYQYTSPAPLTSPATLASATATSNVTRDNLTKWVRGFDYKNDEFGPGGTVNIRPYIHGDVLHSRPVVINYGSPIGVVVFYGSNDGVYRAINGNQTAAISGAAPGGELWGFIPSEFYGNLKRLHDNSPVIKFPTTQAGVVPAPALKDYFADGPTGLYQLIKADGTPQTAYIYLAMRRGGRFIYALDVTVPTAPKFLWEHSNADTGFSELGQSWSLPKVAMVKGYANPVLIFAAGYDTAEDAEPPTADTMGRGIYVLDATTGALIWKATYGAALSCPDASAACTLPNMTYSIPSDITLMDHDNDGKIDRFYVGDVGGNIWRVDLEPTAGFAPANWQVEKFAALGCNTGPCALGTTPRKFLYAPEVISVTGYDAVFAGSGDREHPLYTDPTSTAATPKPFPGSPPYAGSAYAVTNRIYMLKDTLTGKDGSGMVAITEQTGATANLFDSTNTLYNNTLNGYYITLGIGSKIVNAPLAVAGYVYMSANKPDPPKVAGSNTCEEPLGEAVPYKLSPFSGAYVKGEWESGGLPPSPVAGVVNIWDSSTSKYILVPFCIGCGAGDEDNAPASTCDGSALAACRPPINVSTSRKRTYWYMNTD